MHQVKSILLAVTIIVIAVSAISLLLVLGAVITPYSIVFAKKHSNGGNNNGNDQKQKDNQNSGSNPPTDQPTNSGDKSPLSDGNPPTPPPPIQTLLPVNPPIPKVDCSKTPNDPSCPSPKTVAAVDCIANPTDPSCPPTSKDCEPSYPSLCIPKGSPDLNYRGPNGLITQGRHDFKVIGSDPKH